MVNKKLPSEAMQIPDFGCQQNVLQETASFNAGTKTKPANGTS
jgi:hypothetical protein